MMNEQLLENNCLAWFEQAGWDVVYGPDIAPDSDNPARENYNQVVLKDVLMSVTRINSHLPEECVSRFYRLS